MTTADRHFIDAHVHIWEPPTAEFPLAEGFSAGDMNPSSFTPEELFAHAHPCGVDRIVLIQMTYYGFDQSYMLRAIREHPGVFSGVAEIDVEAANPDEEMRRLKPQGVRGFRLTAHGRDPEAWFAGEGMQAMWHCGGEEGLVMGMLVNPEILPAVGRMCEQFPDTPVVIDHLARIGVGGVIRDEDVAKLCNLARHKQVKVKVSAFYALGAAAPPYRDLAPLIQRVYDAYGPQRLMWASDCPFQVDPGHNYRDAVELVQTGLDFLSDEDRDWILRRTAEQTFF
jgi:predicted TIM-barrel fold metal-dependent hydrolase